jgi:hypothetical protein
MITLTRSLDIICLRGTGTPPKGNSEPPSWVPSWNGFWSGNKTVLESKFSEWRTTYTFNPVLTWPGNDVLKVWGIKLGTVSGLSSAMHPHGRDGENPAPNTFILTGYQLHPHYTRKFPDSRKLLQTKRTFLIKYGKRLPCHSSPTGSIAQ